MEKVGAPTENNLAAAAARPSSQTAQSQPPTRQAQARAAGTSLEASLSSLQRSRPASSSLQEEAGPNVSTAQSAAAKSLAERYSKLLQYGERVHEEREQALDDEEFERAVSMRVSLQKLSAMEMALREEARRGA